MDEFTSIAIWLLTTFLLINVAVIWFATQPGMGSIGMGLGLIPNTSYDEANLNASKNNYFNTQCSTVQPNDADYAPCFLINIIPNSVSIAGTILNSLWTFLTVWANLLDVILTPIPGGIGILIKNILIPFFGLIQATAIFVVLMKIAGIIRGGS